MTTFKTSRWFFCAFTLWAGLVQSGRTATNQGTAAFLRLGAGARAGGMGDAYTAVANDATAIYWNPAALTRLKIKTVTLMHSSYLDNTFSYDFMGYGQQVGENAGIGVGIQYLSAGSLKQTDAGSNEVGSFTPADLAGTLGYAYNFAGYSVGVGAKWIQSKIVNTASTFALDVGILSPAYLNKRLRWGVVAANFGGKLKYDTEPEDLPSSVRGGGYVKVTNDLTMSVEVEKPTAADTIFGVGTEYRLPIQSEWSMSIRGGYNSKTTDVSGASGFAAGLGIGYSKFRMDYALVPYGDVGLTHLVSISMWF